MNHQRKKNYVDSHVQGSLLKRIILHWLAFFVVAGMSIIMLQSLLGDVNLSLGERISRQIGEFTLIGVIMVCLFPVFLLDTIRFSNRFVGPIARMRRHLREIGETGTTDECKFRGDDFWSEMAGELNAVTERVDSQREEIERLKAALASSGVTARV